MLARGKPTRTSTGSIKFVSHLKEQTLTFVFSLEIPKAEMFKEKGLWRVRGEMIEIKNLGCLSKTS